MGNKGHGGWVRGCKEDLCVCGLVNVFSLHGRLQDERYFPLRKILELFGPEQKIYPLGFLSYGKLQSKDVLLVGIIDLFHENSLNTLNVKLFQKVGGDSSCTITHC